MLQSITTNTCICHRIVSGLCAQHRTHSCRHFFARATSAGESNGSDAVCAGAVFRTREGGDGGLTEETFDAEDTDQLKAALTAKHPALASVLQSAVLAVNQEYVTERLTLRDRDEVAIIPPISGG